MKTFLDYNQSGSYCIGFASIAYRNCENPSANCHKAFVANSYGDGWFRIPRGEGLSEGYGLCIRELKITSKNCFYMGDFIAYKAIITYINPNDEYMLETDKFWIFVHKDFDVLSVLEYIEQTKMQWTP